MPVKLYLSGQSVGYNLSTYQLRAKDIAQRENGRRFYSIKGSTKKELISTAMKAAYTLKKGNALCFGTFTFKGVENSITGECEFSGQYNPYFNDQISKFFKEAQRRLDCTGYFWTKELTKKGVIHYHAVFELQNIRQWKKKGERITDKLNTLWGKCTGQNSLMGFRTDKENGLIIKNPEAAAGYAAKYTSKSAGNEKEGIKHQYPTPCVRKSNNWQCKPITFYEHENSKEIEALHKNTYATKAGTYYKTEHAELFHVKRPVAKQIFETLNEL